MEFVRYIRKAATQVKRLVVLVIVYDTIESCDKYDDAGVSKSVKVRMRTGFSASFACDIWSCKRKTRG